MADSKIDLSNSKKPLVDLSSPKPVAPVAPKSSYQDMLRAADASGNPMAYIQAHGDEMAAAKAAEVPSLPLDPQAQRRANNPNIIQEPPHTTTDISPPEYNPSPTPAPVVTPTPLPGINPDTVKRFQLGTPGSTFKPSKQ